MALGACAGSSVERPETPSLHRSPRHVNVVVSRGGRTIHVGGQGAFDASGGLVGAGDFELQVQTAFRNLETALRAAGASLRDVVELRTYLVTDPAVDLSVYRKARDRHWEGVSERPVATTVMVSGTTVPGALILLEAVAVVPD
jgi:enamine deaminase RidA (YjgF/YER057c/UK114 family)